MKITNVHSAMTQSEFLEKLQRNEDFVQPQKGDGEIAASLQISEEAQKRFEDDIIHFDRRIVLPEYCGIYKTDKAIATALEGCSREEQLFVYDIIRQNFLRGNTSNMTEEERQANISLGMKKAEYAAENFIPEKYKESFLKAMDTIAKIASAGKSDASGNMSYGVKQASYLGHGSGLVETTNDLDVMRTMDPEAYEEYQRIGEESDDEEKILNQSKFLLKWLENMRKDDSAFIDKYEKKTSSYMKEEVKNQELDSTFAHIDISGKESFLEELRKFMNQNSGFLANILQNELANRYWKN